jgi:hypothetical protein
MNVSFDTFVGNVTVLLGGMVTIGTALAGVAVWCIKKGGLSGIEQRIAGFQKQESLSVMNAVVKALWDLRDAKDDPEKKFAAVSAFLAGIDRWNRLNRATVRRCLSVKVGASLVVVYGIGLVVTLGLSQFEAAPRRATACLAVGTLFIFALLAVVVAEVVSLFVKHGSSRV